jgi:hypothetical protein
VRSKVRAPAVGLQRQQQLAKVLAACSGHHRGLVALVWRHDHLHTLCAHAIASAHPPHTHRRQALLRRVLEGV